MKAPAWWQSLSHDERCDLVGSAVFGWGCLAVVLLLVYSRW